MNLEMREIEEKDVKSLNLYGLLLDYRNKYFFFFNVMFKNVLCHCCYFRYSNYSVMSGQSLLLSILGSYENN